MNTFFISTSAEGKSWERRYCCFAFQRSLLFIQTKYLCLLYTYITLPSSCNLHDVIFTKLNALRRHLLETRTIWNTNLKWILRSSHQKKFVKTGVVNVLAKSLKKTYKFHFVSKVADRLFIRITFFIDTNQPTFQRQINVVSTLRITDEIMLIRSWKWNKIRSWSFNVA